jgi:GNAT superfamily N-acetyltransferase
MPFIRPYRPDDLAAVSQVCLGTGHAGRDAAPVYRDHDLLPDVFARPYLTREPDLAAVVDDGGGRAVGYILGTADTAGFVRWFRQTWLPPLAGRYAPPAEGTWDAVMMDALRRYPAHLHINLLPAYQRQGFGHRLMWTFLDTVRGYGVPAVHLAYAKVNIPARQFYKRLGFQPLTVRDPDPVRYVGRATARDRVETR